MTLADGERIEAEAVVCAIPAGPLRAVEITGLSDARLRRCAPSATRWRPRSSSPTSESVLAAPRAERCWPRPSGCSARPGPRAPGVLSLLVPPERFSAFLAAPAEARRQAVLDGLVALYGDARPEPDAMFERAWGVDPFTLGYITAWAPGDLMRVGPLHGTHEPPFYVAGSDHWVAGYMEGAVRTGRGAAAAALGALRSASPPPAFYELATRALERVVAPRCRMRGVGSAVAGRSRSPRPRSRASVASTGCRARSSGIVESPISARTPSRRSARACGRRPRRVAARRTRRRDAGRDLVGEPRVEPRVQLLGDRAQLRVANRAQPQLDPQHPVLAQRPASSAGTGRSSPAAARRGRRRAARRRDPRVAGVGVGVVERLGEQCLAAGEVVVDERGRDAGVHRDPRDPDAVDPLAGDPAHRGGEDPLARPGAVARAVGSRRARRLRAPGRGQRGSGRRTTRPPRSRRDSGPHS